MVVSWSTEIVIHTAMCVVCMCVCTYVCLFVCLYKYVGRVTTCDMGTANSLLRLK